MTANRITDAHQVRVTRSLSIASSRMATRMAPSGSFSPVLPCLHRRMSALIGSRRSCRTFCWLADSHKSLCQGHLESAAIALVINLIKMSHAYLPCSAISLVYKIQQIDDRHQIGLCLVLHEQLCRRWRDIVEQTCAVSCRERCDPVFSLAEQSAISGTIYARRHSEAHLWRALKQHRPQDLNSDGPDVCRLACCEQMGQQIILDGRMAQRKIPHGVC